jgi:peptide-methionine (S)-S-oxide reductase
VNQIQSGSVSSNKIELATLGGGCFWCTEAVFNFVRGVEKVESGYSGGALENPTYEQVSTGTTGHAEVVQISFDPEVILFKEILEIFFLSHDPTTLNRQGNDVGTQYRSVIFYHNDQQKAEAEHMIKEFTESKTWKAPILTKIEPFQAFYKAEEYHQNYFKRNPEKAYCQVVIAPKIEKLHKYYLPKLKLQLRFSSFSELVKLS